MDNGLIPRDFFCHSYYYLCPAVPVSIAFLAVSTLVLFTFLVSALIPGYALTSEDLS